MIRYADVLLLYAETLNEMGKTSEAYTYVDLVRHRANMEPLSTAQPGLSKDQFLEQLKHERVVELSGEVTRFFDLKRWGMYNASNAIRDPNFETFVNGRSEIQPIPQSELDLNSNLIQGAQSLFGVRTDLKFGKTNISAVFSEQRSQSQNVVAQGGGTLQEFNIFALDYEEDRHYFLAHYFRDNYDLFLKNYPWRML